MHQIYYDSLALIQFNGLILFLLPDASGSTPTTIKIQRIHNFKAGIESQVATQNDAADLIQEP